MPRQAREKGEFSTYHVIQRGNERKSLFLSDDDRLRFLDTLARVKVKYNFILEAYCLMDNHIHMLINDNGNDISQILKSVNISYAYYFNRTYQRTGHLFQDRFKSELINSDQYLLQVSKYIHNNPVKAGMVKKAEDYQWSSYAVYLEKVKDHNKIIDSSRILGILSKSRNSAIRKYTEYVSEDELDLIIMDVEDDLLTGNRQQHGTNIFNMAQAEEWLNCILINKAISFEELNENIGQRNEIIKEIRKNSSITLKQIGQLFGGISESRVSRILKNSE
ncbi:REP-associated tyrosine transposase [Sporomusa acidovorans]|uniref:Transposase IS200-like domain-containing protein n=1 Tax=Sporomusa acidovorans (strain ATCC 49682 / DSM 3132 / Mol) TaxID=1123286 RepID=A0ABZ3J9U8_SPOA4|nr:transposase [Sporomusa acidovorans]OZC16256.1 transposase IS200 like protein [Sporomusa acidovorans DSM 3132]SDE32849.1 REP element-mobilizing transposase RayT [Sporomusa acidovorans]